MNIIANNPFRILGVFANDPVRLRIANMGKIFTFNKINQKISFPSDMSALLEQVQRPDEIVEKSKIQLHSPLNQAVFGWFWFHRNETFTEEHVALQGKGFLEDVILEQANLGSYSGYINASVLSLIQEEYDDAASYYAKLLESGRLLKDFKNSILADNTLDNRTLVTALIEKLLQEYPSVDWYSLLLQNISKDTVKRFIKDIFIHEANFYIKKTVENHIEDNRGLVGLDCLYQLKKKTIKAVKIINDSNNSDGLSAESVLVLDSLSLALLSDAEKFYENNKYDNEQSALPTQQMVLYASKFANQNETIDKINEYLEFLENEISHIPPKIVLDSAEFINIQIQLFCKEDNSIEWSLELVNNCAPYLLEIKEKVGKDNQYYKYITSRIADNSLFNCTCQLNNIDRCESLENQVKQIKQFIVNLQEYDLDQDFRENKLSPCEHRINLIAENNNISLNNIRPEFSLKTEEEILVNSHDYNYLLNYKLENPNSAFITKIDEKLCQIEKNEFPAEQTISSLLHYKTKYINSHLDDKVLMLLEKLILTERKASIEEAKLFLRLYPDYSKRAEVKRFIESVLFSRCKTLADFQSFLNDNPNGFYMNEVKNEIEELKFKQCSSISDYNQFILEYPSGKYTPKALSIIEDLLYKSACQTKKYSIYLERYPNGKYSQELKDMLDLEAYNLCTSKDDFIKYLKDYPQGKYVELAQKQVERYKRRPLKVLFSIICVILLVFIVQTITESSSGKKHFKEDLYTQDLNVNEDRSASNSTSYRNYNSSSKSTNTSRQNSSSYSTSNNSYYKRKQEQELYKDNQLSTGSKPYKSLGRARTGDNYLSFTTSGDNDYVIIVKRSYDLAYVNHIYIQGGDNARMYLPDGTYKVFFYSGKGWNPKKLKGELQGGFVLHESIQEDGPLDLYSAYCQYTLYPVRNGNLRLKSADADDVFN